MVIEIRGAPGRNDLFEPSHHLRAAMKPTGWSAGSHPTTKEAQTPARHFGTGRSEGGKRPAIPGRYHAVRWPTFPRKPASQAVTRTTTPRCSALSGAGRDRQLECHRRSAPVASATRRPVPWATSYAARVGLGISPPPDQYVASRDFQPPRVFPRRGLLRLFFHRRTPLLFSRGKPRN